MLSDRQQQVANDKITIEFLFRNHCLHSRNIQNYSEHAKLKNMSLNQHCSNCATYIIIWAAWVLIKQQSWKK